MQGLEKKTVLITGATGLVGSNLVHKLLGMGDVKVIALARNMDKVEKCFSEYFENANFEYIIQDVVEPIKCEEFVDFIFHAAGPIAGKMIHNYPMEVIRPNLYGMENCLSLLYSQKKNNGKCGRLIVFSSATVYGEYKNENILVHVTEENTQNAETLDGINAPYSEVKRMSEVFARAYAKQYDVDCVIARLSYVYGYTDISPNTAFYEFIDQGLKGGKIAIKNQNMILRDNIYVDDAVKGLLLVATKGNNCESYNISSNGEKGNYTSVDCMATIMVRLAKEKYKLNSEIDLPSDVIYHHGICMDNNKLKSLGWTLKTSLLDGIMATMDFMYNKIER